MAGHAVDENPGVGRVFRQVREVLRLHLVGVFAELSGEKFCVVATDLEGDERTDVPPHGVGGRFVEL